MLGLLVLRNLLLLLLHLLLHRRRRLVGHGLLLQRYLLLGLLVLRGLILLHRDGRHHRRRSSHIPVAVPAAPPAVVPHQQVVPAVPPYAARSVAPLLEQRRPRLGPSHVSHPLDAVEDLGGVSVGTGRAVGVEVELGIVAAPAVPSVVSLRGVGRSHRASRRRVRALEVSLRSFDGDRGRIAAAAPHALAAGPGLLRLVLPPDGAGHDDRDEHQRESQYDQHPPLPRSEEPRQKRRDVAVPG